MRRGEQSMPTIRRVSFHFRLRANPAFAEYCCHCLSVGSDYQPGNTPYEGCSISLRRVE
jgi:hypothetical protein